MGGVGDFINPVDSILMGLSRPLSADDLPLYMLCPSSHRVERHIIPLSEIAENIPFYVCNDCKIIYRYQECKLIPGEEGLS